MKQKTTKKAPKKKAVYVLIISGGSDDYGNPDTALFSTHAKAEKAARSYQADGFDTDIRLQHIN